MRVFSHALECIHLDPGYALLSVQNCVTCLELFRMLDIHSNSSLNDAQFEEFLENYTDLTKKQVSTVFELLDIDQSGEMEFDEFYLVFCILISCKDQYEKEFIYRHSPNIFSLIDADMSGLISSNEFGQMGVLFNFDYNSILSIFNEFDVSGDKNLDFGEFRLFTMACIDEQRSADAHVKVKALTEYHMRLLYSLSSLITRYIRTGKVPLPRTCETVLEAVPPPQANQVKRRFSFWDWRFIKGKLIKFGEAIGSVFCGISCLARSSFCSIICRTCRGGCGCKDCCTEPESARLRRNARRAARSEAKRRGENPIYYHRKVGRARGYTRYFVPVKRFSTDQDKGTVKGRSPHLPVPLLKFSAKTGSVRELVSQISLKRHARPAHVPARRKRSTSFSNFGTSLTRRAPIA